MNAEQRLPDEVVDISRIISGMAVQSIFEQPNEERPPLSAEAGQLLGSLLEDPFAFDGCKYNKASTASFVWRLGVVHNLSRRVLTHAQDVLSLDPELYNELESEKVTYEMLEYEPELLRNLSPAEQLAFWRLAGYDPEEEINNQNAGSLLLSLTFAKYIPEDILEQVRSYRDSTATMEHQAETNMVFNLSSQEMAVETDEPTEREKELKEALVRVLSGAFVARHSSSPADTQIFEQALWDFADRALTDTLGLDYALDSILTLIQINPAYAEPDHPLLQPFRERILRCMSQLDMDGVAVEQVCDIVHRAHHLRESVEDSRLQEFVARGQQVLENFETFNQHIASPVLSSAGVMLTAQQMLAVGRWAESRNQVSGLLTELEQSEAKPPTPQSVVAALQDEGYGYEHLRNAMWLVGSDPDPQRRQELTRLFDGAINEALQKLPADHDLSRQDSLRALDADRMHIPYLAYFDSGRRFLDAKIDQYLGLALKELDWPDAWQNLPYPPDLAAAICLRLIHNALWYNRHYCVNNSATAKEVIKGMPRFSEFIQNNFQNFQTSEAEMILQEVSDGLRRFYAWVCDPSPDPQTLVTQDLVYTFLAGIPSDK